MTLEEIESRIKAIQNRWRSPDEHELIELIAALTKELRRLLEKEQP